ncbi:hypothetical protein KCP69_25705 [Salmonella enterica subsp. enterica]|nr:hypothetical protein KCP69_25705 [Salmonella enterica subsp. enterica]
MALDHSQNRLRDDELARAARLSPEQALNEIRGVVAEKLLEKPASGFAGAF